MDAHNQFLTIGTKYQATETTPPKVFEEPMIGYRVPSHQVPESIIIYEINEHNAT